MIKYVLILFFYTIINYPLQAQIQFKSFGAEAGVLGVRELHEVSVDNRSGQQKRLRISCAVNDAQTGRQILTYIFPDVMVPAGIYGCKALPANPVALHFNDADVAAYYKKYYQLPAGQYKLCYNAQVHYSELTIIPLCFSRTAVADTAARGSPQSIDSLPQGSSFLHNRGIRLFTVPQPPATDSGALAKARDAYIQKLKEQIGRPDVKFSGTAFLSYDHMPDKGMRSASAAYPSSFMVSEVRPQLSVYGIPVGARLLFTYDSYSGKPFFNQVNAEFDKNAFRQGLQQRLTGVMNAGKPQAIQNLNPAAWGNIPGGVALPYGNINSGTSSFNMADRAAIKQYRYDREKLLRYRDSLEWTDPARAGEVARLVEQAEFLNTSELLRQQDHATHQKYEDSLRRNAPDKYADLKNLQSGRMLQDIQGNNWPDDPSQLSELMPMSRAEKFFYNVHDLSLGRAYLDYTPLSMQGIAVTGADMAYTPGRFFIQGSTGMLDMKQSLWFQDSLAQRYTMYAGRAGYGSPEKDHVHFIYASFRQKDAASVPAGSQELYYMPVSNSLAGASGSIGIAKGIRFGGEYLHAENRYVSQTNPWEEASSFYHAIDPDPLANEALNLNATYEGQKYGTFIIAAANRIGMEYRSIGNPYLRNDVFNYGIQASQPLYSGKLRIKGGYRQETDNLSSVKTFTTRSRRYEMGLALAVPRWPVVNLQYIPVMFDNRAVTAQSFQRYGMASSMVATASHNIAYSGKNFNSSVLFSHITNANNLYNGGSFELYTGMLAERITLDAVSGLNLISSYSASPEKQDSLQMITFDGSYYTRVLKKVDLLSGLKLNHAPKYDLLYVYCRASYAIGRNLLASLYMFKNVNPAASEYQNDLIQFRVSFVW